MRVLLLLVPLLVAGCIIPIGEQSPKDAASVTFEGVRFETDKGTFTAILYPEEAPETVAFFKRLVSSGYYDGREFNRVIPGFVIQEVDRAGGATDQPDTVKGEFGTRAMFSGGALGIARSEHPDSGGSEFFVMDFAHSHLYGNYTAFAQVVDGMDVVRAIARVQTVSTGPASGLPLPPPVFVHDRVALVPGKIERASVVTVDLSLREVARYPLVVGESLRHEWGRVTLEWPAQVRAGDGHPMTWYVYTGADADAPDLRGASAVVHGPRGTERVSLTPDATDARVLAWHWSPPASGVYNVTLEARGNVIGWANIDVVL